MPYRLQGPRSWRACWPTGVRRSCDIHDTSSRRAVSMAASRSRDSARLRLLASSSLASSASSDVMAGALPRPSAWSRVSPRPRRRAASTKRAALRETPAPSMSDKATATAEPVARMYHMTSRSLAEMNMALNALTMPATSTATVATTTRQICDEYRGPAKQPQEHPGGGADEHGPEQDPGQDGPQLTALHGSPPRRRSAPARCRLRNRSGSRRPRRS